MFEKERQEDMEKSMSPKSKDSLVEMARKIATTNPGVAKQLFEKAGLSPKEIQAQMMEEESRGADNETVEEESQEKKELLKKMYEEQLKKARISGDDFQIRACERALKKLEE